MDELELRVSVQHRVFEVRGAGRVRRRWGCGMVGDARGF